MRRIKAVAISLLMLQGCAASDAEVKEVLDPSMDSALILEKADCNGCRLGSYAVKNTVTSTMGDEPIDTSSSTIYMEFDDNTLYMVSQMQDDSWRLAKYDLINADRHTLEGNRIKCNGYVSIYLSSSKEVEMVLSSDEAMEVEDYISIPAIYLRSTNTYEILESTPSQFAVRISGYQNAQDLPQDMVSSADIYINQDLYVTKMEFCESYGGSFLASQTLEFSDYNISFINKDLLEDLFEKAQSNALETGTFADGFLLSSK